MLQDKSMLDEGCLELLEKDQEKFWRHLEEIDELRRAKRREEESKLEEEEAKRCQRKVQREARNDERELQRREEESKLMEERVKARTAGSLLSKFKQGKVAFIAKDWGR